MLSAQSPPFPVGSIIVCEKLSSTSAEIPEMLAVLAKRRKGFNPKGNDWEFLVVSGDGKKIEKREKTGACLECHASRSQNDLVFSQRGTIQIR